MWRQVIPILGVTGKEVAGESVTRRLCKQIAGLSPPARKRRHFHEKRRGKQCQRWQQVTGDRLSAKLKCVRVAMGKMQIIK